MSLATIDLRAAITAEIYRFFVIRRCQSFSDLRRQIGRGHRVRFEVLSLLSQKRVEAVSLLSHLYSSCSQGQS
jgi:hypothetical protein